MNKNFYFNYEDKSVGCVEKHIKQNLTNVRVGESERDIFLIKLQGEVPGAGLGTLRGPR
jgi:hypothetical protein